MCALLGVSAGDFGVIRERETCLSCGVSRGLVVPPGDLDNDADCDGAGVGGLRNRAGCSGSGGTVQLSAVGQCARDGGRGEGGSTVERRIVRPLHPKEAGFTDCATRPKKPWIPDLATCLRMGMKVITQNR
jgi:hypothetical protein